jgi:vacuolar-type H+-ATPase subunit H
MEEKQLKESEMGEVEVRDALQKVRQAEEKARLMIEEARLKTSPEIIKKAITEAEELKKKIVSEAKLQAEMLKKDIIGKAEAEARTIKEQTEVEKQMILGRAETHFNQAVAKATDKLLTIIKNRKS